MTFRQDSTSHDYYKYSFFPLAIGTLSFHENTVDPDQLASDEIILTVFYSD